MMTLIMWRFMTNLLTNIGTSVLILVWLFLVIHWKNIKDLVKYYWTCIINWLKGFLKHIINHLIGKKQTLVDDEAESIEAEWMLDFEGFKLPRLFARGPDDKTRRLFWKTIRRHIKRGVPIIPSDTPDEMAERIKTKDISSLVEDYKQVRYGRDE